jgi:hypothetical protein
MDGSKFMDIGQILRPSRLKLEVDQIFIRAYADWSVLRFKHEGPLVQSRFN